MANIKIYNSLISSSFDKSKFELFVKRYIDGRKSVNDSSTPRIKDIFTNIQNNFTKIYEGFNSFSGSGSGASSQTSWNQSGNSFGSVGVFGTNDNKEIQVRTNGVTRYTVTNTSLIPFVNNNYTLGSNTNKFQDLYSVQTTVGSFFECGLRTDGIRNYPTGTTLVWGNNGCEISTKEEDINVVGIVKYGKDEPIILGAEPVLVTGKIKRGDFLVTSKISGHCKSIKSGFFFKNNLVGKIIAQALEDSTDDSNLIKAIIRKM